MKKFSIRLGSICLFAIIGVMLLMNLLLVGLQEFTSNALLVLILLAFAGLWASYVVEKNLIMVTWIPTIVLFLMGRPLALLLGGEQWLYHGPEVTRYYLLLIALTALGMSLPKIFCQEKGCLKKFTGCQLLRKNVAVMMLRKDSVRCSFFANYKSRFADRVSSITITKEKINDNNYFKLIITLGYVVTFGCYLYTKLAEYVGMQGKSYLDYYLAHDVSIPWIVTFLASFGIYFMCIQLSMARKRMIVLVVLALNILSTVPALLIGQRNPFVLALIFTAIVICLKNKEVWKIRISKKKAVTLIVCAVIAVLILMLAMYTLSSSRNGLNSENSGLFHSVLNFIRDQGNTFEVVCQGITHRHYLRAAENSNYVFSAVVDYFKYGQLGNWLFGTTDIPGGNNAERAVMSNDFAHKVSYLVLGDGYLSGAGLGTSYMIEAFIDFGVLGVLLINLFYAAFLAKISGWFGKSLMLDSAFIYVLLKVFFLGRDNALIPFSGMLTIHFAVVVIGVYFLYYLLKALLPKEKHCNEK